jgi:hypothetical protein
MITGYAYAPNLKKRENTGVVSVGYSDRQTSKEAKFVGRERSG